MFGDRSFFTHLLCFQVRSLFQEFGGKWSWTIGTWSITGDPWPIKVLGLAGIFGMGWLGRTSRYAQKTRGFSLESFTLVDLCHLCFRFHLQLLFHFGFIHFFRSKFDHWTWFNLWDDTCAMPHELKFWWDKSTYGEPTWKFNPRITVLRQGIFTLGCPPSQDAWGKWMFRLGSPTKNVIILVVIVTGRGDNPNLTVSLQNIFRWKAGALFSKTPCDRWGFWKTAAGQFYELGLMCPGQLLTLSKRGRSCSDDRMIDVIFGIASYFRRSKTLHFRYNSSNTEKKNHWTMHAFENATNMAMENPPFEDVFPVLKLGIFQLAMFVFGVLISTPAWICLWTPPRFLIQTMTSALAEKNSKVASKSSASWWSFMEILNFAHP